MSDQPPTIALALQGGGSHGAFSWGVVDRLLQDVAAGGLHLAAISGTSAGALNAALIVSGLVQGGLVGGPDLARRKLETFWRTLSRRGLRAIARPGGMCWRSRIRLNFTSPAMPPASAASGDPATTATSACSCIRPLLSMPSTAACDSGIQCNGGE